ncbi:MAG: DUF4358 domain-containing protein [Lachnospiraceae bacterium]|jgi:hypothetical protein|nr:DUF4358 domain-containing protein [Lachnospiraceae bacterium]
MKKLFLVLCMSFLMTSLLMGCKGDGTSESTPEVNDILTAVKEAYGENYLPEMDLDETTLSDMYGINTELIDSFVAQIPMISAHPDVVIIARATEGKGDELESELEQVRTNLVENSFTYPMNLAKTQASQVVKHGDYVALFLVGAVDDRVDTSEEEQLTFAKEETQKAIDAFNSFFK